MGFDRIGFVEDADFEDLRKLSRILLREKVQRTDYSGALFRRPKYVRGWYRDRGARIWRLAIAIGLNDIGDGKTDKRSCQTKDIHWLV